jgi:hypothetical protein
VKNLGSGDTNTIWSVTTRLLQQPETKLHNAQPESERKVSKQSENRERERERERERGRT